MSSIITKKELELSHKYWVANFKEKQKSIDKLCVRTAERLGAIDFEIWRNKRGDTSGLIVSKNLIKWRGEKEALEGILRHFHGFLDLDYIIANDTGREDIERNKTRGERVPR